MTTYSAKIVVRMKSTVKDVKGLTLKRAIESLFYVENLSCNVGNVYFLKFDANNRNDALRYVEQIAKDILANEVIETYEIKNLEEVYE